MVSEDMWDYLNTKQWDARLLPIAGYLATKIDGKVILDLNCGTARLYRYLVPVFDEYLGTDISEEYIAEAKDNYAFGNFHVCADDDIADRICSVEILLVLGYAAGFSDAESETLDDSVRKIVQGCNPEIVVFESGLARRIVQKLDSLVCWTLGQGYGKAFRIGIDVGAEPEEWRMRQVIILERETE